MLKIFRPQFSGTYSPERLRPDFISALAERVRKGLFPRASERRNRYALVNESDKELRFRSEGLLTSINIGWNDVRVQIESPPDSAPRVRYEVMYFAWARYSVILCAFLGIAMIASWTLLGEIYGAHRSAAKTIFWVMLIFWGFVWPWILVAIHKRPAAKALERLFEKVNEAE
ncbi:hypothetical protein HQ563_17940 [bacterium]|nr:hypothetical protein [bacterium]